MIVLHREGTTHEVRGVTCESKAFTKNTFMYALEEGWVKNPADLYQEAEGAEKEAPVLDSVQDNEPETEETEETEDGDSGEDETPEVDLDDLTEDELRVKAKEVGYPYWLNAGPVKLKAAILDAGNKDTDDTPDEEGTDQE